MGLTDVGALKQYVDELPLFLVRRFVNEDESALIVISLAADKNLTQLLPIVDQLDQRLNAARAAHAGYTIEVTGHFPIATRKARGRSKLNRALTVEFAFIAASSASRSDRFASASPASWRGFSGRRRRLAAQAFWLRPTELGDPRLLRLVRPGFERNHPFPQPHDAGEKGGRGPCGRRPAGDRRCGPALILTTFVLPAG